MLTLRFLALGLTLILSGTASASNTIKVFILAGQSNMEGHGKVDADPKANEGEGSLEWLVNYAETATRFKHLVDSDGKWVARDDVQILYLGRKGNLRPGFGAREGYIGPELGFGHVVGDAFEQPVLLIKLAWGGKRPSPSTTSSRAMSLLSEPKTSFDPNRRPRPDRHTTGTVMRSRTI